MTDKSKFEFHSKTPNANLPNVYDVSGEELLAQISRVNVVDVRRPDEWVGELGHIAEAKLIPLNTLPAEIAKLPKDAPVVFVCRSGTRSAQAVTFAQENGFSQVFNLSGGMVEWCQKQLPSIERSGG